MTTAVAERRAPTTLEVQPARVVVVSEDPDFIEEVRLAVENMATRVIACLGPTASPCFLEEKGVCPLVAGSAIVLVDAPFGGSFRRHWKQIAAGEYAERLQKSHPSTFVVLSSNGCDSCGPAGEVAVVHRRETALLLLKWALPGSAARIDEAMSTRGGAR